MQDFPSIWPDTPEKLDRARARFDRFADFAERYRGDESLRARIESGDVSDSLAELGIDLPASIQAKIVADTPDTAHFVLPPDPNIELADETLGQVAGGKTAGSAGSVGTGGTMACSTIVSCVSSAGTAGTVGTAS